MVLLPKSDVGLGGWLGLGKMDSGDAWMGIEEVDDGARQLLEQRQHDKAERDPRTVRKDYQSFLMEVLRSTQS